ncbi:MAG: tRNA (guanosine(37)-N1)-methyltransferase TrmD [Chloroflexota bacterium]|nr:tRNA (guanosine(37)-N1)-methyltransferase TrmD [Chloroflexota bacterium]
MLRVDILTLFPDYFRGPLAHGTLSRAVQGGLLTVAVHNLRNWAEGKHRVTDDYTFGGGTGMVMKPEPFFRAVADLRTAEAHVILLSPSGRLLDQDTAKDLASHGHLILLCGRYEGVDERVAAYLADDEISIGNYVVSGGELPALVVLDATARHVPGVLGGGSAAVHEESFATGLLEYPHYTRPASYQGMHVPEVLLSGNHQEIDNWRRQQSLLRTRQRRPEMLLDANLSDEDIEYLDSEANCETSTTCEASAHCEAPD